jgi:hypothetical protein
MAALHGQGLIAAPSRSFDVLVPATRRPTSTAFVRIHRTTRMPSGVIREGTRRYALPPRALADAARSLSDLTEVRALIAGAVQRGDCPLSALARELREGQMGESARLRQVLGEVADGVRSVTEAEFRDLIKRAGLPWPKFNARLFTADGSSHCGRRPYRHAWRWRSTPRSAPDIPACRLAGLNRCTSGPHRTGSSVHRSTCPGCPGLCGLRSARPWPGVRWISM